MKNYQLNNIDPEDLEDFLVKTETSFGIRFTGDELRYISTFGQLCDHILALQTVGQVAEKMAREHYVASRRNPETVNKNEIEKVLTDWFCGEFTISPF